MRYDTHVGENSLWVHNDCPLGKAAKRLGIDLDDISIVDGVANIKIEMSRTITKDDVMTLKEELKRRGATSLRVETDSVIHEKLKANLEARMLSNKGWLGGKIMKGEKTKGANDSITDYVIVFEFLD